MYDVKRNKYDNLLIMEVCAFYFYRLGHNRKLIDGHKLKDIQYTSLHLEYAYYHVSIGCT